MSPSPRCILPLALLLCGAVAPGPAAALERLFLLQEFIHDRNASPERRDDFLDTTVLAAWPQAYAALTLGSFDSGMELGGHARDGRGSAYLGVLRRRTGGQVENTSVDLETEQKLGRRAVGAGSVRFLWPDRPDGDALLLVPSLRADYYYGGDSFVSVRATYDPRPDTGTTIRVANRLGGARWQIDTAIAPRTDGAVGWGLRGRWDVFVLGCGYDPDFDFTTIDRQNWFLGFQYDFGP